MNLPQSVSPANGGALVPLKKTAAHVRHDLQWLREKGVNLKPVTFKLYTYLIARIGKNQSAWPSQRLLADDADISYTSAKRALSELKEAGLIDWTHCFEEAGRKGKKRQTSNDYYLPQKGRPSRPKIERRPSPKKSDETNKKENLFKTETNSVTAESVCEKNSFPDVAAPGVSESEELSPLALELFRAGVEPRAAAAKLAAFDPQRAREVLDYVARPENWKCGGGLIRNEIVKPNRIKAKPSNIAGTPSWQKSGDVQNAGSRAIYRASETEDAHQLPETQLQTTPAAPATPPDSGEIQIGLALADPETRGALCDAVFETLPSAEQDKITARAKAGLPPFLQENMRTEGARATMKREIRKDVLALHGDKVRHLAGGKIQSVDEAEK